MRILVADDEAKLARLIAEMLELAGHHVDCVTGGKEALARIGAESYDLVLTDLRMPDVDGLVVLTEARKRSPAPEVIVMTAHGTAETAVQAMKAGAIDYLLKPFSIDEVRLRVNRIASERSEQMKNARLVDQLIPSLVADSGAMRSVLAAARQVALTDTTVLILGETGTGKSQLARYIHYASKQSLGPFVEVHCSALPESLLESELFGFEKGAFTGADQRKTGLLLAAEGGTLFLDEIGEVSLSTQVKLLRFLQDRTFVALGSSRAEKVNARVVAATNRDLDDAVKKGVFREDLYYRLNVFPLRVPPLRDRMDDILPLAARYLKERGVPPSKLSPEARQRIATHAWPGNVRELENALERALILAADDPIELSHFSLPTDRAEGPATGSLKSELIDRLLTSEAAFDLDGFERDLLYAAIARTGGNKAAAARLLGITRRRLYSRIKSLNERLTDDGSEE
jgi:DNA-binding NtrC family response regulator